MAPMAKKHNTLWFKNRVGKKVYCNDHPNKNVGWYECEGIVIENVEVGVMNLMKAQNERGVEFTSIK